MKAEGAAEAGSPPHRARQDHGAADPGPGDEALNRHIKAVSARHHALDAVRGLAALGVANYHFLHYGLDLHVQSAGTFTVYLFFALSALTMMMVYGDRFRAAVLPDDLARFYRARAARIIPLLALVSVVGAVLTRSPQGFAQAALTGSGALALGPAGFISWVTGAWSLGIELAFYAIFPLLALGLSRLRRPGLWFLFAGTLVAQQLFMFSIEPLYSDPGRHWQLFIAPLTFAPFFMIGFLVHATGEARSGLWVLPMLLLLAAMTGFSLVYPGQLFTDPPAFLALTLLVGLLLYAAWRADLPRALTPIAEFLGEISYSLYLTHFFIFLAAQSVSDRFDLSPLTFWLVFIGAALAAAWLSYRLFERPLRQWLGVRRPAGG